jgi:hypothetical protein
MCNKTIQKCLIGNCGKTGRVEFYFNIFRDSGDINKYLEIPDLFQTLFPEK